MMDDGVVVWRVNINSVGIYIYITITSHDISDDISCDVINGDENYKQNCNTVDCVDLLYQLTP